jgi:hypothetical protein
MERISRLDAEAMAAGEEDELARLNDDAADYDSESEEEEGAGAGGR